MTHLPASGEIRQLVHFSKAKEILTWCFLNHGNHTWTLMQPRACQIRIHTPSWKESGFERRLGVAYKNNIHLLWERRQQYPGWKAYPEMLIVRDLSGQKGDACEQRSKGSLKTLNTILKMGWGKIMKNKLLPLVLRKIGCPEPPHWLHGHVPTTSVSLKCWSVGCTTNMLGYILCLTFTTFYIHSCFLYTKPTE